MSTVAAINGWGTGQSMRHTATLQQLNAFGMRNLSVPGTQCGTLMDLYFKIMVDQQDIYVSEITYNTLNPVWVPFQLEPTLHTADPDGNARLFCGTSFDVVVFQVQVPPQAAPFDRTPGRPRRKSRALSDKILDEDTWQTNSRSFSEAVPPEEIDMVRNANGQLERELFRFSFNVRELDLLPVELADVANLPLNTCVFEFASRCYVRREVIELLLETGVISSKHSRRKGSAIQVKEYSIEQGLDNLQKIMTLKHQVEEIKVTNAALKDQIQKQVQSVEEPVKQSSKRALVQERIDKLRTQVAEKKEALARVRSVMFEERKTFDTDIHIPKALWSTMQMGERYKREKDGILQRRSEVLRAASKIRQRQATLVKQLETVYPIEYVGAGEYSIRGIKIANADLSINSRADEELISTALGYIAHLVFMLSKYLHVSLRYKVVPFSSRSFLKDEINDPQGDYPLYRKGAEKERYEKAILYLRKDVEQLLFSRGLDPTQGSPILARLKALSDAETTWLDNDRELNQAAASNGMITR
ncbi:TPA: hypothetical protein N0F65_001920 [Lagenidium giganteum]|uniref:Uncharacterized protein n=1 Tax=Lagenidium giganteum TaxID=4803 RepID=A0AAV2Z2R0_9STRA|nr:TPA: hypothetical protein N0F65_001920 [Lagenidium giganteum]